MGDRDIEKSLQQNKTQCLFLKGEGCHRILSIATFVFETTLFIGA